MRPEVLHAWRNRIQLAARAHFPEFQLIEKRVRGEPRGMIKYEWRSHARLWNYIAFRPLSFEAFDAFIAWSVLGRFPIGEGAPSGKGQNLEDFEAPFVIDWSMSFVPRTGSAHWSFWTPPDDLLESPVDFAAAHAAHFSRTLSADEAVKLVQPAVDLAIAEVRDYGLPYLRRRVAFEAAMEALNKSSTNR